MNVIDLFNSAGIQFEQKEQDNLYIACEKCHKDNLSVNAFSGAFHCWSLGCEDVKGGIHQLGKMFQIEVQDFTPAKAPEKITVFTDEEKNAIIHSVNNKTEVIEWALSRSLDPDFVMGQGVGFDANKKAIVFPYRDEKQNLIGARYRSTFYKTQWVVGREPDLYILDYADLSKEKLIIVEGEVDELTIKQMGFPCVAILGSRKDNGYKMLRRTRSVYLGYDMDGPGEAGIEKAATILGRYRCKRIKWTAKDPNQMLQDGASRDDFKSCLRDAETLATNLTSLSAHQAMNDYTAEKSRQPDNRKSWGYERMNGFTKGILPGWTIYLLAKGGAGKTTMLLNIMMNIMEQGTNVGIASYEEDPILEITPKIATMIVGRNPGGGDFDPQEIALAQEQLKKVQIFTGGRTPEAFCEWVRECYYVHNTRFFVADYLQMVVDDTSPKTLLDSAYTVGKDLAKELPGINIMWAVQPKLLQKGMDKNGEKKVAKIDGSDARGGSVIEQACDVFVVMSPVDGNTVQVEFTKVRGQLVVSKKDWLGQITQLQYEHATLRQIELKNLNYGG